VAKGRKNYADADFVNLAKVILKVVESQQQFAPIAGFRN
jgi:hypothetical protein